MFIFIFVFILAYRLLFRFVQYRFAGIFSRDHDFLKIVLFYLHIHHDLFIFFAATRYYLITLAMRVFFIRQKTENVGNYFLLFLHTATINCVLFIHAAFFTKWNYVNFSVDIILSFQNAYNQKIGSHDQQIMHDNNGKWTNKWKKGRRKKINASLSCIWCFLHQKYSHDKKTLDYFAYKVNIFLAEIEARCT